MNRFFSRYEELGQEIDERYRRIKPKPTLRINTLKIDEEQILSRLKEIGVKLEKVPFLKYGYYYDAKFSLGATPEYLQGYYYLQEAASQIPAEHLELEKTDIVLDMASAPGSKTTHMAQIMNNEGTIVAIDINEKRLNSVRNNAERCGVKNIIGYNKDANDVAQLGIKFDKILLDAPCSGNYTIDRTWFDKRKIEHFTSNSKTQKDLLEKAVGVLKKNGILIYSTCSLEPEENELVVDWALQNFQLKLETIDADVGSEGLVEFFEQKVNPEISKCKRLWPWKDNTQGFFIAKFRKIA